MRARAHPIQIGKPYESKVWVEADTKEELIRAIIRREQEVTWVTSGAYKALTDDERALDVVHDEQIERHMGDPNAVEFTLYFEDGTTEPLVMNLSAATIRHELGV